MSPTHPPPHPVIIAPGDKFSILSVRGGMLLAPCKLSLGEWSRFFINLPLCHIPLIGVAHIEDRCGSNEESSSVLGMLSGGKRKGVHATCQLFLNAGCVYRAPLRSGGGSSSPKLRNSTEEPSGGFDSQGAWRMRMSVCVSVCVSLFPRLQDDKKHMKIFDTEKTFEEKK